MLSLAANPTLVGLNDGGVRNLPPAFSASPLRAGIEHSADPEIPALNLTLLLISRPSGGDMR